MTKQNRSLAQILKLTRMSPKIRSKSNTDNRRPTSIFNFANMTVPWCYWKQMSKQKLSSGAGWISKLKKCFQMTLNIWSLINLRTFRRKCTVCQNQNKQRQIFDQEKCCYWKQMSRKKFPNFQYIFNKSTGFHKFDLTAEWPQRLDIELKNFHEKTLEKLNTSTPKEMLPIIKLKTICKLCILTLS